jgi:stage V sporulation protein AD
MLTGQQSWVFHSKPQILSTGVTGGPFEAEGRLSKDFDILHDDLWMNEDSYEKAHRLLIEEAIQAALDKANLQKENIQFILGGDLINQITPTTYAVEKYNIPYLGLFNACATSMEGLALAALMIENNGANYVLTGAGSHNSAAERQYRYPTEYGGQKPPTAQWTATAAGYAIVSKPKESQQSVPRITAATIGKVVDMGLSDPFNMGGAMAPAAADTIAAHLRDTGRDASYYDLIVTGDLGKIGHPSAFDLLKQQGLIVKEERFKDCGLLIYSDDQPVLAGASGAGCSAAVLYGHLLNQMKQGVYKKILCVATGSLHSPISIQQKETIPCIAHAVAIEME